MICYMPFSYLSEERLTRLIRLLGKIAIYEPGEFLLTGAMHHLRSRGDLDVRIPAGIDQNRLHRVLKDFKGWAGALQSRSGDLSALHRSIQGRLPLVEETHPTQIETQIRRYGQKPPSEEGDPLFQAALFMAMAHEYDFQQDLLARDLGSIQALEQHMFERLTGRSEMIDEPFEPLERGVEQPRPEEAGLYMTEQRLRAWAALAGSDPNPPWLYVTHSQVMWEGLCNMLPETTLVAQWSVEPDGLKPILDADRQALIQTLAFTSELIEAPPEVNPGAANLTVRRLDGCSPLDFCTRISKRVVTEPAASEGRRPFNTLFGLLSDTPLSVSE